MNLRTTATPSLPAGSTALTLKLWVPLESGPRVVGDSQGAKFTALTLHSKVEPASLEVNSNVGVEVVVIVPLGPEVIVVVGATVSTPKVRAAAVPVLPVLSVALTKKMWGPSVRESKVFGELQAV